MLILILFMHNPWLLSGGIFHRFRGLRFISTCSILSQKMIAELSYRDDLKTHDGAFRSYAKEVPLRLG